ncbi:sensor domain-containing diguanylate cyclase [Demequina oxidasica]|uniref:sensor domain-containing diguanylate cyclase n=1 Tax=Demequina oxidasica TaxID=676199 RepID=UPI00078623D1|nr:sensor domain-containing diguanylate cyclase [Demequina oxidasica]
MNVSGSRRPRSLSRSRSLLIGAAILIAILLVQMITSVIGAVVAQRQATDAAKDTFSYVGDLTAERVSRYAASGEEVVGATTAAIEDAGTMTLDGAAHLMYLALDRAPEVRGAYVGFPDGTFVSVSHAGTGYTSQRVEIAPEYRVTQVNYDATFSPITTEELDLQYDPRDRPWYITGEDSLNTNWTEPYLLFDSDVTFASVTRAARDSSNLIAVVGADLDVDQMATVLDNLPLGDGAEAFVLSPDRKVIAAPSDYRNQLRATAGLKGEVPLASDIGVGSEAVATSYADGDVFGRDGGRLTLERGFRKSEGLDWILHLEAEESQLSPGLDRLQFTIYTITAFSALMVFAVAVLMYRMWRPLRRLSVRARTDQLTGLANRHEYRSRGARLLRRAQARGEVVVVVVFDIDNFKALNDDLGHDAGDIALTIVGDALVAASRESDAVARLGGDEFVIMQVVHGVESVPSVVERIRETVEHTVRVQAPGGELVGLTAGYSLTYPDLFDLDILMARADAALVAGKRTAKGVTYAYERPDDLS